MNGKIYRTRASTAAIATALLLATPLLLLITPALAAGESISLSPTSGPPGTTVTVSGSGFSSGDSGVVWFDINHNGLLDPGEPNTPATADSGGGFSVSLVVPDVTTGSYDIKADVPLGGSVEASAPFTVPSPSISITPTSGPPGTSIIVVGINFKLGATVTIFFDLNSNGLLDSGESVGTVTASSSGAFSTTVSAPTLPSDTYNVRATDGVNTAPPGVTFTITSAISLSPTSGPPGTTVTVSGSGFGAGDSGTVCFDSDDNGQCDVGEPSASVTASATGTFTATLIVPDVAADTYDILADVPSGGSVEVSASFTVPYPSITITPTSGHPGTPITVTGSNFKLGATVTIFFDLNSNGLLDSGESVGTVTASSTGAFSTTVTAPTLPFGAKDVSATDGVNTASPQTFTVTRAISLSPTSGPVGTSVTVSGSGFASGTAQVCFDSNNNNQCDESTVTVTVPASGTFTTTLTIPSVAAGTYNILGDQPTGGTAEASATFTVTTISVIVSPTTVSSGQLITITGTGFAPGASGFVWFDIDGDSVMDPGEPQISVSVDAGGAFTTILTTPDVAAGTYFIRVDIPPGSPIEASAPVVVAAPGFAALMAAISDVSAKLGTFGPGETVKSLLDDIETKLDPGGAFYTFVNNWFTTINNKLGTFSGTDTVASLLYAIEDKLDDASRWVSDADLSSAVSTITSAISDVSAKLGTFSGSDTVASLLNDIKTAVTALDLTPVISAINDVSAKLGTFSGSDTVASLLNDIKTAMVSVKAGDVVASKAETDKTTTSATPYVIGGFTANKAFRGTLTVQIDTALGSGVFLAVQVWDGDSWATVWRSATGAPAGTAVSIDIAGLTDGSGNAVRIVTNAATARQFDYVFVYHIDLG
jgi:hypothetical protein